MLLDGLLILLYFGAITTIGLRMGRRENTLADFALGGRQRKTTSQRCFC